MEEVQEELTSFSISANNQGRVSQGPAFFAALALQYFAISRSSIYFLLSSKYLASGPA